MQIARNRIAPWIVAAFIVAGGLFSFANVPHPLWMMVGGVVLPGHAPNIAREIALDLNLDFGCEGYTDWRRVNRQGRGAAIDPPASKE